MMDGDGWSAESTEWSAEPTPEAHDEYPTLDTSPDAPRVSEFSDGNPPASEVPSSRSMADGGDVYDAERDVYDAGRGEAYDTVGTDDLGAEWLARATESASTNRPADAPDEFEDLTTVDLLADDVASLPTLELDPEPPDSQGLVESEAVLADRNAKAKAAEAAADRDRPRPLPRVFDIAELLQDEDAPSETGRRT